MDGALLYCTRYGSTAEYARWIGDASGVPVYDLDGPCPGLDTLDFVVVGSPVIYHRLVVGRWARRNLAALLDRPVALFTVSGAGAGAKLDGWIEKSLPGPLIRHMRHFALRGRQDPRDLTWFDRGMLTIGGLLNPDRSAGREELHGFDFMDKASISPIVEQIRRFRAGHEIGSTPG